MLLITKYKIQPVSDNLQRPNLQVTNGNSTYWKPYRDSLTDYPDDTFFRTDIYK